MKIIKELTLKEFINLIKNRPLERTKHSNDRKYRESFDEKIFAIIEVDKNHKNGNELHVISEKATISIFNKNTLRYITALKARPAQLTRYGKEIPLDILDCAKNNQKLGLNKF